MTAPTPKNMLLGIGRRHHGDDALGPVFARAFRHPDWLCRDAGTMPENFTGLARRLKPSTLLLLDAADMHLPPGSLRRLAPAAIQSGDFGTHAGSIGQLALYLADCVQNVVILGIQPATTTPGNRLSPPVRTALKTLAQLLHTTPPWPPLHNV